MKPIRRLWELLYAAMVAHEQGSKSIFYNGYSIKLYEGYIPMYYLCMPSCTGSTEGKRTFRKFRADPLLNVKHAFEIKRFPKDHPIKWGYRMRRQANKHIQTVMQEGIYGELKEDGV